MPAIASGTIGASVRSAMIAQPDPERPEAARRAADRAFGHLHEDPAVRDDGPGRRDVRVDADAAAPDRQQAADWWISRSRQREVNVDGALPRNQARGSTGSACMTTNGSIQPRWAAPTSR